MFDLAPFGMRSTPRRFRGDFDDLWNRFWVTPDLKSDNNQTFAPKVDIKETETAFEVTAEIPGLSPEDLDIKLDGDILTIKGEKKVEKKEENGDYHLVERHFGSFERSFRLPVDIDREKLEARHKDGVLNITLPKSEKETATQIKIETK